MAPRDGTVVLKLATTASSASAGVSAFLQVASHEADVTYPGGYLSYPDSA
jgi:hypothetical protein